MPAYHSAYNDSTDYRPVGNMVILPIRTKFRGPAPTLANPTDIDVIDESLDLFKANSLFRNFEIKGLADRVLIYLILFISDCLNRINQSVTKSANQAVSKNEIHKQLLSLSLDNFYLPGEPGFPMNGIYSAPKDKIEADLLRQYLTQIRQECSTRLIEKVFNTPDGKPSKWWMCFQKRKFMGKSLS
ncbi:actin-related protein 2/3 complex subunit 3 [Phakopsora pachyrhizi]|uniref:Actin-related protein 2/3 complex subunit 3 n=1 Tax=Phakopsora pachyrhizi TaxID=170000 RepID=A0AAV0AJK1_PHAPC|nr:actin-related protein 2/3 complex subunit 3 [Phakopsora pachyrhizi]CAH7666934.1 actin-related protein 2/3 complex subunit 3 [Phakopsora pachyrhizi]CAH7667323.1 actin-related protein 2/3 complex subunit 3 [Phakopsora pachyrhizi]